MRRGITKRDKGLIIHPRRTNTTRPTGSNYEQTHRQHTRVITTKAVDMATQVTVVAPDVRTAKVKVTPGTLMIDVLEEACNKLHLASDKWTLK